MFHMALCAAGANIAVLLLPKVGSTSLKAWAVTAGAGQCDYTRDVVGARPDVGMHVRLVMRNGSIVRTRAPSCTNTSGRVTIAFIRDPIERVVSTFQDKVVAETCTYPPFSWVCRIPSSLQWESFIDAIVSHRMTDVHVLPQESLLDLQAHSVRIYRFDNLSAKWPGILRDAHVDTCRSSSLHFHCNRRDTTNRTHAMVNALPTRLQTRLYRHFRRDTWLFNRAVQ